MEHIILVKAEDLFDLERFYPVLKELRTELSYQDFIDLYKNAHERDGYEMVGLEYQKNIIAVMGYRILYDFVHGKHLYIDDLVSTESYRSKGFGARLLKYAEELAQKNSCNNLGLCTGIENEQGKNFYERNGWNLRAVVYKKILNK